MPSGLCLPGSFWASRRRRKRTRPFLGPACRNWGASSQPGPGRSHPSPLSPDTHCYTQSPELRPGLGLQRFFHSNGIISLRLFKSLWSIYRGGLGGAAPWAPQPDLRPTQLQEGQGVVEQDKGTGAPASPCWGPPLSGPQAACRGLCVQGPFSSSSPTHACRRGHRSSVYGTCC